MCGDEMAPPRQKNDDASAAFTATSISATGENACPSIHFKRAPRPHKSGEKKGRGEGREGGNCVRGATSLGPIRGAATHSGPSIVRAACVSVGVLLHPGNRSAEGGMMPPRRGTEGNRGGRIP